MDTSICLSGSGLFYLVWCPQVLHVVTNGKIFLLCLKCVIPHFDTSTHIFFPSVQSEMVRNQGFSCLDTLNNVVATWKHRCKWRCWIQFLKYQKRECLIICFSSFNFLKNRPVFPYIYIATKTVQEFPLSTSLSIYVGFLCFILIITTLTGVRW